MPFNPIDREPFPLPIIEKAIEKDRSVYTEKVISIIKAQAIKVISGQVTDFEKCINSLVETIWQDGYSKGLSDMDKMHGKAIN